MEDSRPTLHVAPGGTQAPQCLYCDAVMDVESRHGGKPQQFCLEKPCRALFWREARRVGGHVLRRRRVRARRAAATVNESVGKSKAESKRLAAFLIAAGAVALGLEIPGMAR